MRPWQNYIHNMKKFLFGLMIFLFVFSVNGQDNLENWMNSSSSEGSMGIDTDKTYTNLIKDKKGRLVIVAVLDSGVDVDHEDLASKIWVNQDEIPDNGIDDDNNGYIDDIHGWNFIGGPDGENVHGETLEVTRLYVYYRDKFKDVNPINLSEKEKKEYAKFLSYKKEVETQRERAAKNYDEVAPIATAVERAFEAYKKEVEFTYFNTLTLDTFYSGNQLAMIGNSVLNQILADSGQDSLSLAEVTTEIIEQLNAEKDYYGTKLYFQYNPDFDSRATIVKDDYLNGEERIYGNNDVEGPDAHHGTHVSGIIGAIRNNSIGMNGVAENVQIMSIRVVPDGDERDKDVANGIRYAVDNGATIINMSFGKGKSWDKDLVDEAVKYAAKHDVLLVHAAGNDGQENTLSNNYPHDHYNKKGCFLFPKKRAKNWIEVGALSTMRDTNIVAQFSNYSAENVDVFAPGELIYSTIPDDQYELLNGTSMAAPVVSGMAAVIRSYFPTLTAEQVKRVLEESVIKLDQEVIKPGGDELIPFAELSKTGGVVNLYQAYELAARTKGKKKVKEEKRRDRV